jgi:8-oxo-dGTP diphosphatase
MEYENIKQLIKIATGVFVICGEQFLLWKKTSMNNYCLPGGWLEIYEEFEECARRELKEEINLNVELNRIYYLVTMNCINEKLKTHHVAVYFYVQINEEEKSKIKNLEPDKCEELKWVEFSYLKNNYNSLCYPLEKFLAYCSRVYTISDIKSLLLVN